MCIVGLVTVLLWIASQPTGAALTSEKSGGEGAITFGEVTPAILHALASRGSSDSRVEADPGTDDALKSDAAAMDLERRLNADIQPLLARYCLDCHSGSTSKGGVEFESLRDVRAALGMADDLEIAHELVTTREMPPAKAEQPTDHERLILSQWLESMAAYVPPDSALDPGWFTIHRLNRAEYRNTMRDLLGIATSELDVSSRLPKDDSGYGFDNIADVLTMSPLALEQYLDAAERAVEHALGPEFAVGSSPRSLGRFRGGENGRPMPQGGFFFYSNGGMKAALDVPVTGEYVITLSAWETPGGDERARLSLRVDGKEVQGFDISGVESAPQEVSHRLRLKAGKRSIAAHFTNDYWKENVADRNLAVEWVTIAGPLDEATIERPPAWREIFGGSASIADEGERARDILSRFAGRAFRRPISMEESEALLSFYASERAAGYGFEGAVRQGLIATLVSPNFLYRSLENPASDDPRQIYRLSGVELASRLSYFLWSSMPDQELMSAALDGSLLKDEVLGRQVERMLADARSDAFVEHFAGQWLQLRMLDGLAMDTKKFPAYSTQLARAMQTEATMFFASILRNNASIVDFLDSGYTFVNQRL
ncbi:MAG TPA: DUF1592 domain-containing protein, partial [Phycisphaerales bacterium]|nr:DUF1592 domain-containing protein [Phycisphaerales bacterium]